MPPLVTGGAVAEERVAVNRKEADRLSVIHVVSSKGLKQTEAARQLGLCVHQAERLIYNQWLRSLLSLMATDPPG